MSFTPIVLKEDNSTRIGINYKKIDIMPATLAAVSTPFSTPLKTSSRLIPAAEILPRISGGKLSTSRPPSLNNPAGLFPYLTKRL